MTDLTPEERAQATRFTQIKERIQVARCLSGAAIGQGHDQSASQETLRSYAQDCGYLFAALAASEAEVSRLRAENTRLLEIEREVKDKRRRQNEWDAFQREGNVRCIDCDLRYAEREDYACHGHTPHRYDEEELAEAREVRGESR